MASIVGGDVNQETLKAAVRVEILDTMKTVPNVIYIFSHVKNTLFRNVKYLHFTVIKLYKYIPDLWHQDETKELHVYAIISLS